MTFSIKNLLRGAPHPAAPRRTTLIGRLVAVKKSHVTLEAPDASQLLFKSLRHWPKGQRVEFLMTPGGFLEHYFDGEWAGGRGWRTEASDFVSFRKAAREVVEEFMTADLKKRVRQITRFLTVGVDLRYYGDTAHCETVVTWDAKKNAVVAVTGKSLPAPGQEHHLVGEPDLVSHFQMLNRRRVLVLGCHDLNFFSERAKANQAKGSPKKLLGLKMSPLVRRFRPQLVLQHPRSTDTPATWRTAWGGLRRSLGDQVPYAGGVSYYTGWKPRASLEKVLEGTRSDAADVFDFLLR